MPINKETIISVFDDKLTLMQWLKTINKALEDAVLTGVEITKKGNATLSFKFTFEDGTYLETNDLVLQQGESVVNAFIQNGHLYLTLSNGTNLDAGNVKPVSNFTIDANQHLIVNYGDGTSQDLGAIFNGNVTIQGTLDATKVTGDEIVEKMSGYSFEVSEYVPSQAGFNPIYVGMCKNGNKLTLVVFASLTRNGTLPSGTGTMANFSIPWAVGEKIIPYAIGGGSANIASHGVARAIKNEYQTESVEVPYEILKYANNVFVLWFSSGAINQLDLNEKYLIRIEQTFLLSDNLVQ